MTPDDLIDELQTMFGAQRFREMVDLVVRVLPEVRSQMTLDHSVRLHELMHIADTLADLDAAEGASHQNETVKQPLHSV
jgi:hypothetical protein